MTQIDDERQTLEILKGDSIDSAFLARAISLYVSANKLEYLIASELLQETSVPTREIREVTLLNGTKISTVENQPKAESSILSQMLDRIIFHLIQMEEHEKVGPDSKVTSGELFLQREKILVGSGIATERAIV